MARKPLVKSTETAVMRILMVMMICPVVGLAQVGIGVTGSVNASAKLQVDAANKGFLPPRVALSGTSDVSTIVSPATGLLVYNTATAGTSPANVTPGFYYYDGSKWQRIINQQPDATISFDKATPTTSGVAFTPNTPNSTDYIYVSSVDNSQWTYNGSAYVTYTPPASTPWMLSGNTTDAGSNKSDAVFRTGSVTIGGQTTSPVTTVASSAQLEVISTTKGFLPPRMTSTQRGLISTPATGLVVYQTDGTAGLYYYDGTTWLTLTTLTGTETLTNKTISGSSNTITNVSLTSGVTGTLPIANGGTGQTTANAALNALLPSQSGNANKVLVTDGTSTAWNTNVALTSAVTGVRGVGAANIGQNSYTGAYITLPNGKWSVTVSMLAVTSSSGTYWLRTGFSASSTSGTLGADAVGATLVSGLSFGGKYSMLNGTIIINNTSGSNKTYYYWTGEWGLYDSGISGATFINLGRDQFGENTIIAYPMN